MIRTAFGPVYGQQARCSDESVLLACSLRMGEILGLTWNNVHISDDDIADDNAYVFIDKELARASKRAIEMPGAEGCLPHLYAVVSQHQHQGDSEKAQDGFQYPQGVAAQDAGLHPAEWKKAQDELRGFLGDEYQD